MYTITGKYTTALITLDSIDENCIKQITEATNHPAFTKPIAIMPDAHAGKGSVIGFTMELTDKIIPTIIGVDIGCGMLGAFLGKSNEVLNISLEHWDKEIRKAIPFGFAIHNNPILNVEQGFPWNEINDQVHKFVLAYSSKFGITINPPTYDIHYFKDKCKEIGMTYNRGECSIGTLGGGNHFIELGKDIYNDMWLVIHSGSRNFGKCICDYWQKKAQDNSPNGNKAMNYLEGENLHGYLLDMLFAQKYAEVNRKYILEEIQLALKLPTTKFRIETIHNFIDPTDFIIRKGAIASYKNKDMLIPFNPRDGILICSGKSNPDWNFSASHGAGRIMSRSEAKRQITREQADSVMSGVFASEKPLDESPLAYKDAQIIEKALEPTVTIENRIKPILNMKTN